MIYDVTQFGLPKNIAAGVTEACAKCSRGTPCTFPRGSTILQRLLPKFVGTYQQYRQLSAAEKDLWHFVAG